MMEEIKICGLENIRKYHYYVLCYLDKFCKEHDIKYSLYYGTLIGAIRHNGFVPWDDDIDVVMTWPNYIKFLKSKAELDDLFRLYNAFEDDDCYHLSYSRLIFKCGLGSVDVFPITNAIDNPLVFKVYSLILKGLRIIADCKSLNYVNYMTKFKRFLNYSIHYIFYFVSYANLSYIFYWFINCVEKSKLKSSKLKFMGAMGDPIDKSHFEHLTTHVFEGHIFPIYEDYDAILRSRYGDYMKYPPIEERCGHPESVDEFSMPLDTYNRINKFLYENFNYE